MLPVLKPLPQPHLNWIEGIVGVVSRVWWEYLQSLDRLLRTLKGLEGSATFNPSNLADGAGETTTVAVTGAALGDFAMASFSLNLQGITLTAWVSAADTVSVRFQNESGSALNLDSGTLRVRVIKQ